MSAPEVTVATGSGSGLRPGRWFNTVDAAVASTYALDTVATGAGVLLVASQLLSNLDHRHLLVFLGGTYLLWGAGLRVNLRAKGTLLQESGTSTNAPSKAAYDLVKGRTRSVCARKIACPTGYVATELAKEMPYYVGAFGGVLLSDSVSSKDTLIFLGGANCGAAVYEYGLS